MTMTDRNDQAKRNIDKQIDKTRWPERDKGDTDIEKSIRDIPAMQAPEPWPDPPDDDDRNKDKA